MKASSVQSPAEGRAQASTAVPWTGSAPEIPVKRSRLARLRKMGLVELAWRGRQEARKLIERLGPEAGYPDAAAFLREHGPALATPEAALRFVREAAPARFFAGIQHSETAPLLRERLPHECSDLIAAATDTIIARRIDLLGYRMVPLGDPIDWHRDPVSGRRSPLVHWSRVDPLDPAVVGDSKVVWELNRHQWVVRLAQAWTLTHDERYAAACIDAIDSWLDANPPEVGINWASSLEVSYRLISWCWVLLLIRDLPFLSGRWVMRVLAAVWLHATHVTRYVSYYFSPNTHLTGEGLGLFYAGVLFDEFHDAPQWRHAGMRILFEESRRQISSDGVHFEQSTCYHRYTMEIYQHLVLLASQNGIRVPASIRSSLSRMVDFLLAVRQPDGSIPAIGDADGGALLPLAHRSPDNAGGVFAVAAAMFDRADFAWAAGGATPEVLWLLGPEGLDAFDALGSKAPAGSPSRIFPVGGYAVLRDSWDDDANQMIVDVGPLGCPVSSGHGHADLLSIQCAVAGQPCLADAGNYSYTPDPEWRDFFRSTWAHNTAIVDGRSQAEPAGTFAWRRRPRVLLREWRSDPEFDFLDAEHDAFGGLADPVVHRRRVLFIKPRYWILIDDFVGMERHRIDLLFQFVPMEVTIGAGEWTRARTLAGPVLWLGGFASAPMQSTLKAGDIRPIRGWRAPDYGRREPAPVVIYSATAALPLRIMTLLLPDAEGLTAPPDVVPLYDEHGLPDGFVFRRSGESVSIRGSFLQERR